MKTFLLDSLTKHFYNSKYMDYEKKYVNNVYIHNEVAGKNLFKITRIKEKFDMISTIKLGKSTMMQNYIKNLFIQFDVQKEIELIDESLTHIFNMLNDKINKVIPEISLDYEYEDLFNIIQKSEVKTIDGKNIENISELELVETFINISYEIYDIDLQPRIIIFENIDHILEKSEYRMVYKKAKDIADKSEIKFIFTTSIEGYTVIEEDCIEQITIMNDEIFAMPELEIIKLYLENKYPNNNLFNQKEVLEKLKNIVNRIGEKNTELDLTSYVVLKEINESLGLSVKIKNVLSSPEWLYLSS